MKNYHNLISPRLHTEILGFSKLETKIRFLLYIINVKLVSIYKN